jgi:hypothetical protein
MVINDLKQTCTRCLGSGRQAGVSQWGINQINPAGRCLTCEGRGFLLTQLGREVIELVGPFIEEMIERKIPAKPAPPPERREPE